jgi:hypothetical protein
VTLRNLVFLERLPDRACAHRHWLDHLRLRKPADL